MLAAVPQESRTLTKEDRVKLVRLVLEEGYTVAEAARSIVRTLNASGPVSENTVRLWLERFRHTGSCEALYQQRFYAGRMPALGDAELRLIDLLVRLLPDIRVKPEMLDYMNGLRADHDHIAASTLYRALKKLGHTHKGLTKRALEADPEDVETYRAWMDLFEDHEHFIWLDETSKDSTTSSRPKGWGPRGQNALSFELFHRGTRYSHLAAMDRNGTVLSMTKEGSIYADDFLDFVSSLAVLHPPGRMFVFDNCRIHMQSAVRACLHAHGHQAVYLPSYSPFLNPIEFFFSELKGALAGSHRREYEGIIASVPACVEEDGVHIALATVGWRVPAEHFAGWVRHCGYKLA